MKPRAVAVLVFVAVAVLAGALVQRNRQSPEAKREKLVEQFIAILPDSLSNDHILEIRQMFYVLRERAMKGAVKPETIDSITRELEAHVKQGSITAQDLLHFMAEVGHATYKDDPRYNLPDGSIDNPVLNPKAGMVGMRFDSTTYDSAFWAEFKEWKKSNGEKLDSAMVPNPRTR